MRNALLMAAAALAALIAYLLWYFRWESRQTSGLNYFGRSLDARRALKRRMRVLAAPVKPILTALARIGRAKLTMPIFDYEGVSGPARVSTPEVFARARAYRPDARDVFVATQMRCGTTWMQQLVYQIVTAGRGGFDDPARSHLYTISPWIEAVNGVSIDRAPLVGRRETRIVKTHLPASHCPYSAAARYIYVARHPVSCFASIIDFNRSMLGPLLPPLETMVGWYCSDKMYWRPWPEHVDGWWQWAETKPNVLFLHFEDMKRDLAGAATKVATFLDVVLTPDELRAVVERAGFTYMKEHEEWFEMAPPTMYSIAGGEFLASGKEARHEDVTPATKARILDYCRQSLQGRSYPAARFYPDLAG